MFWFDNGSSQNDPLYAFHQWDVIILFFSLKPTNEFSISYTYSAQQKLDGMTLATLQLKYQRNHAQSVVRLLREMVDVCIWSVLDQAVDLNGVGYVKRSGQETVWELIGLVKVILIIFIELGLLTKAIVWIKSYSFYKKKYIPIWENCEMTDYTGRK